MKRGSFQMMKSVNRSIILNKIRTDQPISRAQIAKDTKLTPPTVSNIIKELIEQGFIKETNLGVSSGGRKPTMLQINSNHFFVIGVDIGPNSIDCLLSDLSGKIVHRHTRKLSNNLTNELLLNLLKASVHNIIETSSEKKNIIGIGVAMHGVVDVVNGVSLTAPTLKLTNIPIKSELEKEFDIAVSIENDARAMALGESWFGKHDANGSMLAVNLGRGVGAGIVINGKLYHGANDLAGEVGHMTIDINGDTCECGNKGCLQTFTTGTAIVKRANKTLPTKASSGNEIYQLALEGNIDAIHALNETGKIIGIGLTNLIHVINPELIVLGGGVSKSEHFLINDIRNEIQSRCLTEEARNTKIAFSKLGDDSTLLGAVSLVLIELFSPIS